MSPMSDYKRKLLLELIDGKQSLSHIAFHIGKHVRCEEICLWLIRHKITGDELALYWRIICRRSYLTLMKQVIAQVDKDPMLKPIIGGTDYV